MRRGPRKPRLDHFSNASRANSPFGNLCGWQVEAVRRNLCRAEEGEVRRQIVEVVETTPTVPSGYNVEEYADSLIQTTRLMAGWDFTRTDDFRRQADANCLYQMRGP